MSSFSVKQQKCIEYLALGSTSQKDIAEEIKINPSTISKWKQDQDFMEAVLCRARQIYKESIPEIYESLTKHAKAGNDRHIKIFLDHLEKLEHIKAGKASITFSWMPATVTEEEEEDGN